MGTILKSQAFTGVGTFTVPANVTLVWVTLQGSGGGGGGGQFGGAFISGFGGGGGGAGEYKHRVPVSVTPGANISISLGGSEHPGKGGDGGSNESQNGVNGETG